MTTPSMDTHKALPEILPEPTNTQDHREKSKSQLSPLSPAQRRLWYLSQYQNVGGSYNLIQQYELTGALEVSNLEDSVKAIIQRHPALRTTFREIGNDVFREIHESIPFKVTFHNLSQTTKEGRAQKIEELSLVEANHVFDLKRGPLLAVTVVWLGEQKYRLLLNMHHIISDGWSFEIFKKELALGYNARIKGQTASLPALQDLGIHDDSDNDNWEKQIAYWQHQFKNVPQLLELPTNKVRPSTQTFNGKRITFSIDRQTHANFTRVCRKDDCSDYIGFLSAFKILLSRYAGKEDIVVGSPFSGRHRDESKKEHIDVFVRTIPLRTTIEGHLNFCDTLKATGTTISEAFKNQDIPFDKLVEAINPERNPSFSPIFQVMFAYQNYKKEAFVMDNLTITKVEKAVTHAKFDLTLEITEEHSGQLNCAFDYNVDIYDDEMIRRLVDHYQILVQRLAENRELPVKDIPILTDKEHEEMVFHWNETSKPYPKDKCFHQLFEEQVKKTPNAIALSFGKKSMTYDALNRKANKLAHLLISMGIEKEDFVGIQLDRSFEMVISVLAVLKSGGAYVAIDPEYPVQRKEYMLHDAAIKFLLSTANHCSNLTKINLHTILVDQDSAGLIASESDKNPNRQISVNDLAYMIYTSGSTGQPKGVLIEHKGLPNLIIDHIRKYELRQGHCVLQFASLSFDASICEIGMALLSGATLCIAQKDQILPGPDLIRLLNQKKISHVTLPPSALSILPKAKLPHLKVITVTGEACPEMLVDKWSAGRKFFNGYGPSEATIGATISEFRKGTKKTAIGRPFANYKTYLLDDNLKPVPVGVPGEIYIGGIGLARGYYNNEDATNKKFINNPFTNNGEKIYKTGDIGRYLPNGDIDFIGRIDNLVKLRGMRIELGEIETAINDIPNVNQCKVVLSDEGPAMQKIIAYYTVDSKGVAKEQLKLLAEDKLPKHMVPAIFYKIDQFPKSPNGKIDIKALPKVDLSIENADKKIVAPRNDTEKAIMEIWVDTLNIEQISIHDNFFDLGGHSLLAVYMVTQIEKRMGVNIVVSALMKFPTIARLSNWIIQEQQDTEEKNTIVPIREEGTQTPLFLLHTPSGNVLSYYQLAAHLPADYPVYGVQIDELGSDGKPYYSLKDMATYYARKIRKFKPQGPYHLGGYCFGGLLAYEVSRELQSQGQKVDIVFLIGSRFPSNDLPKIIIGENETISVLEATGDSPKTKPAKSFLGSMRSRAFYLKKRLLKYGWLKAFQLYKAKNWVLPSHLMDYKLIHHEMIRGHHPQSYHGNVILIQPDGKSHKAHMKSLESWRKLVTGKVYDYRVPGEQAELLKEPAVDELATLMGKVLASHNIAKFSADPRISNSTTKP
ncbi:non-ribosomal peptide synthetase [Agaribacillus aureus]